MLLLALALLLGMPLTQDQGAPAAPAAAPIPPGLPRPLQSPFERMASPAVSPDGQTIALGAVDAEGRSHIHLLRVDGGGPVALTSGACNDRDPAWSFDGRWIAFVSDRSGSIDVWVVPASGGTPKQVTNDGAIESQPAWSPDGKSLVFSAEQNGVRLLYLAVLGSAPAAGFPVSAGTGPDRRPTWSPDGEWLAFESKRDGVWHVWVMPSSGGDARRLGTEKGPEHHPFWSADSRRVSVFASDTGRLVLLDYPRSGDEEASRLTLPGLDGAVLPALSREKGRLVYLQKKGSGLGVINFEKGGGARPVNKGWDVASPPSWSPDRRHLVVTSEADGQRDLFTVGISSGRLARLTDSASAESDPDWGSPSGDILFCTDQGGRSTIRMMEPETGRTITVLEAPGQIRDPAWSPDGKRMAYVSDREGSLDVWIAGTNGEAPRRITTLPGAETDPTWSPDGTWIAYASDQRGRMEIWKVPVEGGDAVRLTQAAEGGSDTEPAWNSKGTWIAYTHASATGSDIYLVEPKGGKPFPYFRPPETRDWGPAWSPDSTYIAYAWSEPDELFLLDLSWP